MLKPIKTKLIVQIREQREFIRIRVVANYGSCPVPRRMTHLWVVSSQHKYCLHVDFLTDSKNRGFTQFGCTIQFKLTNDERGQFLDGVTKICLAYIFIGTWYRVSFLVSKLNVFVFNWYCLWFYLILANYRARFLNMNLLNKCTIWTPTWWQDRRHKCISHKKDSRWHSTPYVLIHLRFGY